MTGPATPAMPSRMVPLTPAQEAVVLRDDVNLLVGAGAGSGKTTTVVQKLCYMLGAPRVDQHGTVHQRAHPLAMRDIAAITFTNQAAADLKRKLRSALRQAGMGDAASDVDRARIGTIHNFCSGILRDFALRAGLPPSRRVVTEGESSGIAVDAARAALHEAARRTNGGAADPWLIELVSGRRLTDVIGYVARLARARDQLTTWNTNAAMLRNHERALLALATRAAELHDNALAALGATDFNGIITGTRDLLRDDRAVRHAVQRDVRAIFIDEFQDVDPAQRDIAFALAGIGTTDPAPSRIVLVGDPKQSIYRFRGADVSLWAEVARVFAQEGAGERIELTDNFRSKRGILAMVDTLVGARLAESVHDDGVRRAFEVDYVPLTARSSDRDGDECVELLCIPAADSGKCRANGEVRALEATAIAARIGELQRSGSTFGEMALLLASWTDVEAYEGALRAAGIPTYTLRASGFWDAREVVDCLLALRAIRDRDDTVALVGFLKGPFVQVRDETLLALATSPLGIAGSLATEPRERERLDRALALLDRFSALRDRLAVHDLLEQLVYETGFQATLVLDPVRGTQAIGNIRKLLRIAAQKPDRTLGEFLTDVVSIRERADKESEERLQGERADVVTITSVHSAKGLEWPIVFWCDLVRELPADNSALLCGRDLFRLKTLPSVAQEGAPDGAEESGDDAGHQGLMQELKFEARAESFRLWYVASTRPQRLLVLSGVPLGTLAKSPPSVAARIRERFGDELLAEPTPCAVRYSREDGESFQLVVRVAAAELPSTSNARSSDREIPLTVAPHAIRVPTGGSRLSASQLALFARDPEGWHDRYVLGGLDQQPPHVNAPSDDSVLVPSTDAAIVGTIVHRALELCSTDINQIEVCVKRAIETMDMTAGGAATIDQPALQARASALARAIIMGPEWQRISSAQSARHELAFTRVLPDGTTIEGAFDLAAVAAGTARILDAKTGANSLPAALRFAVQGAVYREAADAIRGAGESTFAVVQAVDGSVTEIGATGVSVDELVTALRNFR